MRAFLQGMLIGATLMIWVLVTAWALHALTH